MPGAGVAVEFAVQSEFAPLALDDELVSKPQEFKAQEKLSFGSRST
jgi:hypothetical protein